MKGKSVILHPLPLALLQYGCSRRKNLFRKEGIMPSEFFRRISAPVSLQIEVTSYCNAKCKHCYNGLMDDIPRYKMSTETANAIWQAIFDNQVRDLVLTGGEPLLNWPITKFFLEKGKTYHYRTLMNSNVTLLTEEIADELKEIKNPSNFTGSAERE